MDRDVVLRFIGALALDVCLVVNESGYDCENRSRLNAIISMRKHDDDIAQHGFNVFVDWDDCHFDPTYFILQWEGPFGHKSLQVNCPF